MFSEPRLVTPGSEEPQAEAETATTVRDEPMPHVSAASGAPNPTTPSKKRAREDGSAHQSLEKSNDIGKNAENPAIKQSTGRKKKRKKNTDRNPGSTT